MKTSTFIKFQDVMHDNNMKPISVRCNGKLPNCPKFGLSPCLFMQYPTTSITDMVAYVSRNRCPQCEIPIDDVLDQLEGF